MQRNCNIVNQLCFNKTKYQLIKKLLVDYFGMNLCAYSFIVWDSTRGVNFA